MSWKDGEIEMVNEQETQALKGRSDCSIYNLLEEMGYGIEGTALFSLLIVFELEYVNLQCLLVRSHFAENNGPWFVIFGICPTLALALEAPYYLIPSGGSCLNTRTLLYCELLFKKV